MDTIQFNKTVTKLKNRIATKGWHENLGQKELSSYKEWLFDNMPYCAANAVYQDASNLIDSL